VELIRRREETGRPLELEAPLSVNCLIIMTPDLITSGFLWSFLVQHFTGWESSREHAGRVMMLAVCLIPGRLAIVFSYLCGLSRRWMS
jgi:hypothetical protein